MEVYQALASSISFEMGCKGNANCRNLKICRDKNCKFWAQERLSVDR